MTDNETNNTYDDVHILRCVMGDFCFGVPITVPRSQIAHLPSISVEAIEKPWKFSGYLKWKLTKNILSIEHGEVGAV